MSKKSDAKLLEKVVWLRQKIQEFDDSEKFSHRTGIDFFSTKGEEQLGLEFFNEKIRLTYPELVAYSHIDEKPLT